MDNSRSLNVSSRETMIVRESWRTIDNESLNSHKLSPSLEIVCLRI